MIKNAFCFMLKALLVLKIYNLLSLLFVHAGRRRLDKKAKVNVKTYDDADCETNNYNTDIAETNNCSTYIAEANNYNTHIAQYLKK